MAAINYHVRKDKPHPNRDNDLFSQPILLAMD